MINNALAKINEDRLIQVRNFPIDFVDSWDVTNDLLSGEEAYELQDVEEPDKMWAIKFKGVSFLQYRIESNDFQYVKEYEKDKFDIKTEEFLNNIHKIKECGGFKIYLNLGSNDTFIRTIRNYCE